MQVIPLTKTHDGHFELMASINKVQAKFVLDTGATGTVIDTNKLNMFGITKNQEKIDGVRVGDADTGKIDTFQVDIEQFSIGQLELKIKSIYANDKSGQFDADVVGLIGHDALSEINALLDVKNAQLLIPENLQDIEILLGSSAVQVYKTLELQQSAMGFSFIDAVLLGNQVRLLVDSGAPELILDENVLIELGVELENHPTAKSVVAEGIELPMKVFKKGHISIGDAQLIDDFMTTDFGALMNAVNSPNQPRLIGVLGNKHLAQLSTIIDVKNAKLYIQL